MGFLHRTEYRQGGAWCQWGGKSRSLWGRQFSVRAAGYADQIETVSEGKPALFGRRKRGRGEVLPMSLRGRTAMRRKNATGSNRIAVLPSWVGHGLWRRWRTRPSGSMERRSSLRGTRYPRRAGTSNARERSAPTGGMRPLAALCRPGASRCPPSFWPSTRGRGGPCRRTPRVAQIRRKDNAAMRSPGAAVRSRGSGDTRAR